MERNTFIGRAMTDYLIKTRRLSLRHIQESDIHYFKKLDNDPEVKAFFPSGVLDTDELETLIEDYITTYETKNLPCFVVFLSISNAFMGRAYFDMYETGDVKIGYLFHKRFWHNGYATEVLKALLAWAKHNIETDYIIAYADKNNKASFKVMQKCGMKYYRKGVVKDMDSRFYRIKNR